MSGYQQAHPATPVRQAHELLEELETLHLQTPSASHELRPSCWCSPIPTVLHGRKVIVHRTTLERPAPRPSATAELLAWLEGWGTAPVATERDPVTPQLLAERETRR